MKITNLFDGYIKVTLLGRSFAMQLPYKTLAVTKFKSIDEHGNLVVMCLMANGYEYVRYIDLSYLLASIGVDMITITKVEVA